jgi:hypothetical protein
MANQLWDGSDGERPAIALDAHDIDALIQFAQAWHAAQAGRPAVWPSRADYQRISADLAALYEAEDRYEAALQRDPPDDSPF